MIRLEVSLGEGDMNKLLLVGFLAAMLLVPMSSGAVQFQQYQLQKLPLQQIEPPQQQQPQPQQTQSCANPISLPMNNIARIQAIQGALNAYNSKGVVVDGHYELCFQMNEFDILGSYVDSIDPSFVFTMSLPNNDPNTDPNKDVHIIGLNIKRNASWQSSGPILKIINNSPTAKVYLEGLQLSNVQQGISLEGTGTVVVGNYAGATPLKTKIIGDANKSGPCIEVKSKGAIIQGADISSCAEAIAIEADDALIGAADKDHVATDMNTIHDNLLGIHVVTGQRNKFGYNLVYDNKPQQSQKGHSQDAILIEQGANEDLVAPILTPFDSGDGNKYALRCAKDQGGNILKYEIQFQTPQQPMLATLFHADKDASQPKKYLGVCAVDGQGLCEIKVADLPADVLSQIKPTECGIKDYYFTALFTGTSSTELLSNAFELNAHISSIVSAPIEVPGTTAGVTDVGSASAPVEDDTTASSATVTNMGESGMAAATGGMAKCSLVENNGYQRSAMIDVSFCSALLITLMLLRKRPMQQASSVIHHILSFSWGRRPPKI